MKLGDGVRRGPFRLLGCGEPGEAATCPSRAGIVEAKGSTMKKLIVLAVIALGGLVVWRRLQQDRAELDLWTEATSSES